MEKTITTRFPSFSIPTCITIYWEEKLSFGNEAQRVTSTRKAHLQITSGLGRDSNCNMYFQGPNTFLSSYLWVTWEKDRTAGDCRSVIRKKQVKKKAETFYERSSSFPLVWAQSWASSPLNTLLSVSIRIPEYAMSGGLITIRENNVIMVNLFISVAYFYQEFELNQTTDPIGK